MLHLIACKNVKNNKKCWLNDVNTLNVKVYIWKLSLQETCCICATQAKWLMLFSKMIAVCCGDYTKHRERQTDFVDDDI